MVRGLGMVISSYPIDRAEEPYALTSGSIPEYLVIMNTLFASAKILIRLFEIPNWLNADTGKL